MNQNKPSAKAVALKYDAMSPKQAPKVVATGTGTLAEEIIALAQQHGIFVHQDEHLSEILSQLDLGQEIPDTMYHVIAELIAFSFVMQGKFPDTWNNVHQRIEFTE
jgi:flagellar biosynthesis protein